MLIHEAWLLPVALLVSLFSAAAKLSAKVTTPEASVGRCYLGLLYQVIPNTLLIALLGGIALALPAAVVTRNRMAAYVVRAIQIPEMVRFRKGTGWDESKIKPPFPAGASIPTRPRPK